MAFPRAFARPNLPDPQAKRAPFLSLAFLLPALAKFWRVP